MSAIFETSLVFPKFGEWLKDDAIPERKDAQFFDGHRQILWCLRIDKHHTTAVSNIPSLFNVTDTRIAIGLSHTSWSRYVNVDALKVTFQYLMYDSHMNLLHTAHCSRFKNEAFVIDSSAKSTVTSWPCRDEIAKAIGDDSLIVIVRIYYEAPAFAVQQKTDLSRLLSVKLPEGMCCDVKFDINGTLMSAHKLILAAYSRFFESMLFKNNMLEMKQANEQPIILKEVAAGIFAAFLAYCYGDDQQIVYLNLDERIQLFMLSDRFQCDSLFKHLELMLIENVNEKNAIKLLLLYRDDQRLSRLHDMCEMKMATWFGTLTADIIHKMPDSVLEYFQSQM